MSTRQRLAVLSWPSHLCDFPVLLFMCEGFIVDEAMGTVHDNLSSPFLID